MVRLDDLGGLFQPERFLDNSAQTPLLQQSVFPRSHRHLCSVTWLWAIPFSPTSPFLTGSKLPRGYTAIQAVSPNTFVEGQVWHLGIKQLPSLFNV